MSRLLLHADAVELYGRVGQETRDDRWCVAAMRLLGDRRTVSTASAGDGLLVPSPGGWQASSGARPGWDWVPPCGASVNASVLPLWVKVWRRLPFIDRYGYPWMGHHGGWLVEPAGHGTGGGDPSSDRAPASGVAQRPSSSSADRPVRS